MPIPRTDEEYASQRLQTESRPLLEQQRKRQAMLAMAPSGAMTSGARQAVGGRMRGETARAVSDVAGKIGSDIYSTRSSQQFQEAQARAAREASGVQYGPGGEVARSMADINRETQERGLGFGREQIASAEAMQGRSLTSNEQSQLRDLEAKRAMFGQQLTANEEAQLRQLKAAAEMQTTGIESAEQMQQTGIQSAEAMQGRSLTSNEQSQLRDLEAKKAMLGQQLTAAEESQLRQLKAAAEMQQTGIESAEQMQTAALGQQASQFGQTLEQRQSELATQLQQQGWAKGADGKLQYSGGQVVDPETLELVDPTKLGREVTQADIDRTTAYFETRMGEEFSTDRPEVRGRQQEETKAYYQENPGKFVNDYVDKAIGGYMIDVPMNRASLTDNIKNNRWANVKDDIALALGNKYSGDDKKDRVNRIYAELKNSWDNPQGTV